MLKRTNNILSIVIGNRYLGLAILHETDLRDWFVKTLNSKTVEDKSASLIAILSRIIRREQINILAMKKPHQSRTSPIVLKLCESIKEVAKREHLITYEYPIKIVETALIKGKHNKRNLTEEVNKIFPIVYNEYKREIRNRSSYLTRMFEAIAIGVVCNKTLDSKRIKTMHY